MSDLSNKNNVFDRAGKILRGRETGFFVKFEHDPQNSGSYYIFTSRSITFSGPDSFDAWVENRDDLVSFFQESIWLIEWPD